MDEILLGIAGLAGLAWLLQSRGPLPSEADFKKAKEKLDTNLLDPDANMIVGKYMAFVLGDYSGAMPYLVHAPDKTLRTLAEHELDSQFTDTPPKKVGMGDEWVAAAKSFQPLSRIFYDRAAQWYSAAWPDLDLVWKEKSRAQGRKLAAARPPGGARKGLPTGFHADIWTPGARPPVLDGNIARTGSYSVSIPAPDEKVQASASMVKSELIPIAGKNVELSAYVLSDGTENAADRIFLWFFDQTGTLFDTKAAYYPTDLPFWNRVSVSVPVPANAVRAQFGAARYSKKGSVWVDDISMKFDGKEAMKNPSFEEK